MQDELDATARTWNSHIIRPSKNEAVPHGRPRVMYYIPELYGSQNYICAVNGDDVRECKRGCTFRSTVACDEDIFELCTLFMREQNMQPPSDAYQALDLYLHLRTLFLNFL